jgi:hypothetical protein
MVDRGFEIKFFPISKLCLVNGGQRIWDKDFFESVSFAWSMVDREFGIKISSEH